MDHHFLSLLQAAFSRPAFRLSHQSENLNDFAKVLQDTKRAINLGELVDRQSNLVIRKAVDGINSVSNPNWKSRIQRTLKLLNEASELFADSVSSDPLSPNNYKTTVELDRIRSNALVILNSVLLNANIPEVDSPLLPQQSLTTEVVEPVLADLHSTIISYGLNVNSISVSTKDFGRRLRCDVELLRSTLRGMLISAMKYAKRDLFQVKLSIAADQNEVTCECADNGVGVSETDWHSVFLDGQRSKEKGDRRALIADSPRLELVSLDQKLKRYGGGIELVRLADPTIFKATLPKL